MESSEEKEPLITETQHRTNINGELTIMFAIACIVDQFGVNPIIVLPRAIIICGWVGIPLALIIFTVTIYTAMLLGKCWVIAENIHPEIVGKKRYPYPALVEMVWGRKSGTFMSAFLNVAVFTSNIPALLIAAQNLQTFDSKVSGFTSNFSYCYWLIILGAALCPLTWLGSPKDMKWISVVSTCAVFGAAILTWTCMVWDNTRAFEYRDIPNPSWQSVGIAYGILSFQLSCHPAMLAIQSDMNNKRHLSYSILCSFFVTGGLFLITTLTAMMLYGGGVRANLTQGLPVTLPLYVDILVITLQLFLSMAVGGCALFQSVEDRLSIPSDLCWQRCVIRTVFVLLTVLIAEGLPRFDLVMGLLGGLFTGPITLIFPPLLYFEYKKKLSYHQAAIQREANLENAEDNKIVDKSKKEYDIDADTSSQDKKEVKTTRNEIDSIINRLKIILKNKFVSLDLTLEEANISKYEKVVLWVIACSGVLATVTATFFSLKGTVWSAQFVPPCLISVKAASRVIDN